MVFVRSSGDCWEAQSTFRISTGQAEKGYQRGSSSLSNVVVGANYTGCPHCLFKPELFCVQRLQDR